MVSVRTPAWSSRVQLTRSVSSWTLPAGTVQALLPLPGRSVQTSSSPAASAGAEVAASSAANAISFIDASFASDRRLTLKHWHGAGLQAMRVASPGRGQLTRERTTQTRVTLAERTEILLASGGLFRRKGTRFV